MKLTKNEKEIIVDALYCWGGTDGRNKLRKVVEPIIKKVNACKLIKGETK